MPKILKKPNTLIDEAVDIYQPPLKDEHYSLDHCEITIGDLHGNSIKLLFMLVKHGIVQNITEDDYKTLVEIYNTSSLFLEKTNITNFNTILNSLTFNPTIGIRLIGSELASHGQNDYFTLKILQKLRDNFVPVEIMISNHSIEFINACETKDCFEPTSLVQEQVSSLYYLQSTIDFEVITRKEVLDIYQTAYLPTLKLLSYRLSDDHSEITLFSHAVINLYAIESLANKLDVTYNNDTATNLAQSIDRINTQFKRYAAKNQIHTLCDFKKINSSKISIDPNDAPVEFIMRNRSYTTLNHLHNSGNYKINYVHSHNYNENPNYQQSHIINLTSTLGKRGHCNKSGEKVCDIKDIFGNYLKTDGKNAYDGRYTVGNYRVLRTPQSSISFALELDSVVNFKDVLQLIETKSNDFSKLSQEKGDAYDRAYKATSTLLDTINRAYETLAKKTQPTSGDVETFKNTCQNAIDASRPVLEAHRGWKQVLGHLALAIAGVGAFYLMGLAAYHLSGSTFTLFKTDSHQKLDNLAQTVNNFTEDVCRTLRVQH